MLARIIVETGRIESYSDVLAAIIAKNKRISVVEFVILKSSMVDPDTLLDKIADDLKSQSGNDLYKLASRLGKSFVLVDGIDESIFREATLIDASCVLKETLVDIASISVSYSRKRVRRTKLFILTWTSKFNKDRASRVGIDPYEYCDLYDRDLFRRSFIGTRASTLLSSTLMITLTLFCIVISPQIFGYKIVSDSLMNQILAGLGLITGIGGIYLSWLSLQKI